MPFKEKMLVSEMEVQSFGAFIRLHRELQNISLGFLADAVKISKAYLSDLEHGKRLPRPYTFAQILKVLDISFNEDINVRYQVSDKLHRIFHHYINLEEEKELDMYEEVNDNKLIYEYSYGFLQYYLIKYMQAVRTNKFEKEKDKLKHILNSNLHFLNDIDKSIYYDLLAQESILVDDYQKALPYLNKALEKATDLVLAIVYYHMSIVYQSLNQSVEGLIYCNKSLEIFNKECTVFRILYLNIHRGNCYSRLGSYDKARKIYLTVLEKKGIDETRHIEITALNNLSWNALKSKSYDECIEHSKKAIAIGSTLLDIYTYAPLAYYLSNKYEECNNEISRVYNKLPEGTYQILTLNALYFLIHQDNDKAVSYLESCLAMELEFEVQVYLLKLICTILYNTKNYDKLIGYQHLLINYGLNI